MRQRLSTHGFHPTRTSALGPIISIGGDQLTGKSTLAKSLSAHFKGRPHSSGAVFRALAAKRGISLTDLLQQATTETDIDVACDATMGDAMARHANSEPLIVEGRLAAVLATLVKDTQAERPIVRLYLHCSLVEQGIRYVEREISPAAGHMARASLPHSTVPTTPDQLVPWFAALPWPSVGVDAAAVSARLAPFVANVRRDQLDRARYQALYELDYRDAFFYDLTIDTTPNTAAETLTQALAALGPWSRQLRSVAPSAKL